MWKRYNVVVKGKVIKPCRETRQQRQKERGGTYISLPSSRRTQPDCRNELRKPSRRLVFGIALGYSGGDHAPEKKALTGAMRALEALRNIHQRHCPVSPPRSHHAEADSRVLRGSG